MGKIQISLLFPSLDTLNYQALSELIRNYAREVPDAADAAWMRMGFKPSKLEAMNHEILDGFRFRDSYHVFFFKIM